MSLSPQPFGIESWPQNIDTIVIPTGHHQDHHRPWRWELEIDRNGLETPPHVAAAESRPRVWMLQQGAPFNESQPTVRFARHVAQLAKHEQPLRHYESTTPSLNHWICILTSIYRSHTKHIWSCCCIESYQLIIPHGYCVGHFSPNHPMRVAVTLQKNIVRRSNDITCQLPIIINYVTRYSTYLWEP